MKKNSELLSLKDNGNYSLCVGCDTNHWVLEGLRAIGEIQSETYGKIMENITHVYCAGAKEEALSSFITQKS